jgi:hypothetical protein
LFAVADKKIKIRIICLFAVTAFGFFNHPVTTDKKNEKTTYLFVCRTTVSGITIKKNKRLAKLPCCRRRCY